MPQNLSHLVHGVKFYDIEPVSITNLCFNESLRSLAVSRSDSSVEIWNIRSAAHVDRIILPQEGISIQCIIWSGERLFCGTLQGSVIEYDLLSLSPLNSLPVTSGTCWCLAPNKSNSLLAVGTEAGYINILNTENNMLMFEKLLDKQEGQIMCLAWDFSEIHLVSGSVDAVRVWDAKTGQATFKMTTGRAENKEPTIVWCLCVTDDFTIITGDSRGKLCFWDGHMGTAISSHQTHKADILAVVMAQNQSMLYCAGVDPLIMSFEKTNLTGERMTWVKSVQRVIHDHDVKALAVVDNQLFSAGIDGYLALSGFVRYNDHSFSAQVRPYQQSNKLLYKYPPLLQPPRAVISESKRCILLKYKTKLEVWKLGSANSSYGARDPEKINLEIQEEPKKMLELHSVQKQRIRCCAFSPDGNLIAYSTDFKLHLFKLEINGEKCSLKKLENLPEQCIASSCMNFGFNSKSLVLATLDGCIVHMQIKGKENNFIVSNVFKTRDEVLVDLIHLLALSCDGKYIIAADRQSNIGVWSLKGFKTSLPRYTHAPTAMAINPLSNFLIVVYSDHKLIEYDLEACKYTKFTQTFSNEHLRQWTARCFPIEGIIFDRKDQNIFMIYNDSTICVIDKEKRLIPSKCKSKIPRLNDSYNSMQEGYDDNEVNDRNCEESSHFLLKKFKHIAYLDWLSKDELVVVEVSPVSLLEKLPPVLKIKRFGKM